MKKTFSNLSNLKKLAIFIWLVTFFSGSLIFLHLVEAKAVDNKAAEVGFSDARQITAVIADVNVSGNFIIVGEKKNAKKKVLTYGAVIVRVTESGAQIITLQDLAKGQKAHIWVRKKLGPNKSFQGFIITQFTGTKTLAATSQFIQFSAGSSGGLENSAPSIVVELSRVLTKDAVISYTVSGTATGGGADYTLANGDLVIPAGKTTGIIPLVISNDSVQEEDETVVITLTSATEATLGMQKIHTYTIIDDEQSEAGFAAVAPEPAIDFGSSTSTGDESIVSVNIPVLLSAASVRETRINYAVTGTAIGNSLGADADHTLENGVIIIPAGQTNANITLTVVNDTTDELDETVIVTLSNPVGATLGSTSVHTYTIKDNDNPTIQFQFTNGTGLENITPVAIGVTLSAAPVTEVQVGYAVSGSATGGGIDYALASGTFTIAAGQLSTNLSLAIVEDTFKDPNETIVVTLVNPINASLGSPATYTHTISDND